MNNNDFNFVNINVIIYLKRKRMTSIKNKTISEIYNECGIGVGLPVSFEAIVEKYGINIFATDFDKLSESDNKYPNFNKNKKVLGTSQILRDHQNNDTINIHYSNAKNVPITVQRFIIAHELGHCSLDYDELINNGELDFSIENKFSNKIFDFVSNNEKEERCNKFARELLVPEKILKKLLSYKIKLSIKNLSDIFLVPTDVIKKRIKELGL